MTILHHTPIAAVRRPATCVLLAALLLAIPAGCGQSPAGSWRADMERTATVAEAAWRREHPERSPQDAKDAMEGLRWILEMTGAANERFTLEPGGLATGTCAGITLHEAIWTAEGRRLSIATDSPVGRMTIVGRLDGTWISLEEMVGPEGHSVPLSAPLTFNRE
jgi:hypothetical protein